MQNTQKTDARLEWLIKGVLVLVGSLSIVPVIALFVPSNLENMYGLVALDDHVRLLLQHRALFFGMIGAGIIASAFKPAWRTPVLGVALLSKVCFVALVASGDASAEINRVALADGVAIILVSIVLFLHVRSRH